MFLLPLPFFAAWGCWGSVRVLWMGLCDKAPHVSRLKRGLSLDRGVSLPTHVQTKTQEDPPNHKSDNYVDPPPHLNDNRITNSALCFYLNLPTLETPECRLKAPSAPPSLGVTRSKSKSLAMLRLELRAQLDPQKQTQAHKLCAEPNQIQPCEIGYPINQQPTS